MPKFPRIAAFSALGGCAVLATLHTLYWAAHREPQFYRQALEANEDGQDQAGDELEQSVLDLHNAATKGGRWEATFTDDQLNGWLATDLPAKFPTLLPPGAKEPRVAIEPDKVRVACRYESTKVKTIISFALEIQMAVEPNQLAIRVCKVRAGMLPLPLKGFLDRITRSAQKADIPIEWKQTAGDPVALVTVPVRHEDYIHQEIHLETFELRDGEVFLAGRTEAPGGNLIARR